MRPTRREPKRSAAGPQPFTATALARARRIRERTCICMRLRKRATVASSTVVHARFRWPFRAGGGCRRSCSNYSTHIHEGTHLRSPPPLRHLHPRERDDVAALAFAHRGCNGRRDDNRPVGGQTIVYLRERAPTLSLTLRYISPPLLRRFSDSSPA